MLRRFAVSTTTLSNVYTAVQQRALLAPTAAVLAPKTKKPAAATAAKPKKASAEPQKKRATSPAKPKASPKKKRSASPKKRRAPRSVAMAAPTSVDRRVDQFFGLPASPVVVKSPLPGFKKVHPNLCVFPSPAERQKAWSSACLNFSLANLVSMFPSYWVDGKANSAATYYAVKSICIFYINQSLQRDGFKGAWAEFIHHKKGTPYTDTIVMKIASPSQDVAPFAAKVKEFFAVGKLGIDRWNALRPKDPNAPANKGIDFSLELGLQLLNYEAVQLLHYPPSETKEYSDFLYAPTVSRWDCLLRWVGMAPERIPKQDRIIDIDPLVASGMGSGADLLVPYDGKFVAYSKAMMNMFLKTQTPGNGKHTVPMVALGTPVSNWLYKEYKEQIMPQIADPVKGPQPMEVFTLTGLRKDKPRLKTAVIISYHPSQYLYDTDIPLSKWKDPVPNASDPAHPYASPYDVMKSDLICASWNTLMVTIPDLCPHFAKTLATARWGHDDKIRNAMIQQNAEYSWYMKTVKQSGKKP